MSLATLAFRTIFLLAGLTVGVPLFLFGVWRLFHGVQMLVAPADDAADAAAGGHVELEGTARPAEETMNSPVFGRDCIAYDYEVFRPDFGNDAPDRMAFDDGYTAFRLETDDGDVFVADGDPELTVETNQKQVVVGPGENPPPEVADFRARNDEVDPSVDAARPDADALTFDGERRYVERVLRSGDTAYVAGAGREASDAGRSVPAGTDAVVTEASPDGGLTAFVNRYSPFSFIVSDGSKRSTASRYLLSGFGYCLFSIPPMGFVYIALVKVG